MRLTDRPAQFCCTSFQGATLTREDVLADAELFEGMDVEGWAPTIEWAPHIGAYMIGHTVIRFCPWCGGTLPDESEGALAESQKAGTWIAFDSGGAVTVTVAGEPVDAAEFLAKLTPSNDG